MRAVIQKSGKASVVIDKNTVGKINDGLVIFIGIKPEDTEKDAEYLADKIANMRIFGNEEKHFEKSLLETGKSALVISQFTLYATNHKGRRPDFTGAAKRDIAEPLYEKFCQLLCDKGMKVETGKFGAMMKVNLINEGPITILLSSEDK